VSELHKDVLRLDLAANWCELADALVDGASADGIGIYLAYLHGAAWRQALPAWMMAALRLSHDVRVAEEFAIPILSTLDMQASKSGGDEEAAYFDRVSGLDASQRSAVSEFLSWAVTLPMMKDPRSSELVQRLLAAWC
jgi:hypothetical protein